MKRILLTYALLSISLTSACSGSATTQEKAVGTKQKAEGRQGQELQDQELRNQIEQMASATKGTRGSRSGGAGEQWAVSSWQ